jgi:hypothetical protein
MVAVSDIFVEDSTLRSYLSHEIRGARMYRRMTLEGQDIPDSDSIESWPYDVSSGYIVGLPAFIDQAVADFPREFVARLERGERESGIGRVPAWVVRSGVLEAQLDFWAIASHSQLWVRLDSQMLSWLGKYGKLEDLNQYRAVWRNQFFESFGKTTNLMLEAWRYAANDALNSRVANVEIFKKGSSHLSFIAEDKTIDSADKFLYGTLAANLYSMIGTLESFKPTLEQLRAARNQILVLRQREDKQQLKQLSRGNFQSFWSSMKANALAKVSQDEVETSFSSIPILPVGTESSRTWGIEIEVVAASRTSRPRGWDARGDGSLEPAEYEDNQECECGCDDCCEYDSHCGYDDCIDAGGSCVEYVSPILNYFNSDGVRRICDDLVGAPCNDSPGIHIHVGAIDLTAPDIARLVVAYSAVSPYIWPVMHRERVNYCRDITSDTIAYWLSIAKDVALRKFEIASEHHQHPRNLQGDQPDDRYHDLNLKALGAHGTVEFRALGPIYDYEHIIRWAWFCREMVNISKLDLPHSTWTSVRSMADVIKVLQTYGKEQLPKGALKLYLKGDNLELEHLEEAKG